MQLLKTVGKYVGRFFELFFFSICIYFIVYWTLSRIPITPERDNLPKNISIFISSSEVHSDVIVPIENEHFSWNKYLNLKKDFAQDSTKTYISIGWGDKNFFLKTKQWSDLTFGTAFKAFFGMGTGAIRIVQRNEPKKGEKDLICLQVSEAEYLSLIGHLKGEFLSRNRKVSQIKKHPYSKFDFFFDSSHAYSLLYTCNSWTNSNLKAAKQKACLWTPFKDGFYQRFE